MKSEFLIGIIAMAVVVVASNILVQKLLGQWLTWGAFTYPIAFLVTDIMNRLFGPREAQKVVFFGFVVGVICSFIGTQIMGEFGPLVTMRIAIASGTAFLIAQLTDILVFTRLRGGKWWRAPVISSFVGSVLDTTLFFALAFSTAFAFIAPGVDVAWANEIVPVLGVGPDAPFWISLAIADFSVKLVIAALALIPFRMIISSLANSKANA